jgi:hypothetical protein
LILFGENIPKKSQKKQKNPERWIPRFYDTNPSPYTIGGTPPVNQTVNRPVDQVQNKERIFGRVGGPAISLNQTDYGGRSSFDSYVKPSTGQQRGTYFGSTPVNQTISRPTSPIPTNNRNYKKFLSLGYKFNVGDELEKIINNNGATI